ncbi:MAG TPA: restriction endonuclease [Solirubrobacteraceae bacterium]|nr:restriction endonuclease [Solirubrobacteraceae bacterium]
MSEDLYMWDTVSAVSPVTRIPSYKDLLWPTLRAVREIGDSGTIEEIVEKVIELEGFTEDQQAVLHGEGPRTKIEYRLAWARTYLKGMGALNNSERGVWSTTERGRTMTSEDVFARHAAYAVQRREARKAKKAARAEQEDELGEDGSAPRDWKEQLLEVLLEIRPDSFERLARRLLREAGFVSATVTGKSGDGGIDGIGVYRLSLVSFPVFFQCKRYRGSVGAGAVRDFRGAMSGRGDKGLLITTGSFTADAKQEATRDGAPPVDLIDGERLCDLLREYALGVRSTVRQVEDIEIAPEFFSDL